MKKLTYYIITIGCQMNKSDSERMAAYLESLGFKLAKNEKSAGVVIINTCGVRQIPEDRVYGFVPDIKKANPKSIMIITGCLSDRADVRRRLGKHVDIWLNVRDLPLLAEKLGFENKKFSQEYLAVAPKYTSRFSAFVPIGTGCNNFCSYCVVPYARGREQYRPSQEIIDEIKDLISRGYKEITLLAQNVNSYRSPDNKKFDFADLIKNIDNLSGDFWLRFFTSHPKDMSDKLIKTIARSEKMCEHVHLPAQAGDDEILRKMNRRYTSADYLVLIEKIKKEFLAREKRLKDKSTPLSITSDIIVGFPGETKRAYNNTKKLFAKSGFDMAYIAPYSPRPGTVAASLKDNISREEKTRREKELFILLNKLALKNTQQYLNKTFDALVESVKENKYLIARTRSNKVIKIYLPKNSKIKLEKFIGQIVKTKINKAREYGLEGDLIS